MKLEPKEIDKLILRQVARVAQERLARGVQLNQTEVIALLSSQLLEMIRDGKHSVAKLMEMGRRILGRRMVMPSVEHTLHDVQVEGTFPDGTKLVTIHNPISTDEGDLELALYGSFLPVPSIDIFAPLQIISREQISGAVVTLHGTIKLNDGRPRSSLRVTNDGDRPIQVGSHYHFIETNRMLRFDRALSYGQRLDIPAGSAVRFEPGESKIVSLVPIDGHKCISGGNALATGEVKPENLASIIENIVQLGFKHEKQVETFQTYAGYEMHRHAYAAAYGPTTGDRVRLGDTELWAKVEKDFTVYGDECVFGGGKVIREGMGQCTRVSNTDALDLVITNCLIIDYTGVFKADIGVKNGMIVGIGKSGNPDVMKDVDPNLIIGATSEVLSAEGRILTAGALDTHVHFICPQLMTQALSSGITTIVGGGTGPNTGTCATTCTPGSNNIRFMLQATDHMPLNIGFTGKGNCSNPGPLREQIQAGAVGLKLHEDWGTTPAAIDTCLGVAEELDVQVTIHTDTLNESSFVEDTLAAFKNRTIHAYHIEGAGGGHAPDIITLCSQPKVIPSSTNPTRPYTKNTLDEHLDMLMVCHHLDKNIPEDIAFAESRIRGETIGAEDVLHDMGAISIISSDSQAMGRIGEVISRTWQTADKMKRMKGHLAEDDDCDNYRIRRYIAKYTINPAIAHGVSHIVGSVEVGKLADLVLWDPVSFGTKPALILKGGQVAWAQMGDPNASIPTPQPVYGREMFGYYAVQTENSNSCAFMSKSSIDAGLHTRYGLKKRAIAVKDCRSISKHDMKLNNCLPNINVDAETYEVTVDGKIIEMPPADKIPLTQAHYLF